MLLLLSDNRSETPPPKFDPSQPFTGVELIISGLPLGSLTAAMDHLNAVVEDLHRKGAEIPLLQIYPHNHLTPQLCRCLTLRAVVGITPL